MLSLFPRVPTAFRLEEHYGLAQRPFALTLDQHFVYYSRSYAAALREVGRALNQREGLVVVTGDTGTGKTMLCRTLVQQLTPATCVSVVLDPRVIVEDLLLHILTDFGVIAGRPPQGPLTRHQLMRALQQFLVSLITGGGGAVLVIDEAQHLDPCVLEQLRLLLNLETNDAKLLQIVLVGHTSLAGLLETPEMSPLNQRVARRCVLEPLTDAEVGRYIHHRLTTAQRLALAADAETLRSGRAVAELVPCNVAFTPSAVHVVAQQSRGVPRIVNLLCDRALEIGHERRTHTIRGRTVRKAAARVVAARTQGPRRRSVGPRTRAALVTAATAAFAVGAAGAGAWQVRGEAGAPSLPAAPAVFAAGAAWSPRPHDVRRIEVFDRLEIWSGPLTLEPPREADRPDTKLLRVALLQSPKGMAVAIELTAEPRKAALHVVSDRIFEVELGPVAGPVRHEQLAPPSDTSLVSQLSIREQIAPNQEVFVRARVVLREPGRGDVRIAGRVVYVDVKPAYGETNLQTRLVRRQE